MDRKAEMDPLPIANYVDAVRRLVQERNISKPVIYVASEDPEAYEAFRSSSAARHRLWKVLNPFWTIPMYRPPSPQ